MKRTKLSLLAQTLAFVIGGALGGVFFKVLVDPPGAPIMSDDLWFRCLIGAVSAPCVMILLVGLRRLFLPNVRP